MNEMTLHHICIQTNCYGDSLAFWHRLGFALLKETAGFHGRAYNSWLGNGSVFLELQTPKHNGCFFPADDASCGAAHLCFYVSDAADKLRQLERSGITGFLQHAGGVLYKVEGGRLFKLRAPEGTVIEFREKAEF